MNYKDFWSAGHRVFPLMGATNDDGDDLPEKEQYKKPRASGYQHSPVWSQEQLELMEETGQFETGYGVLCRGLLVVDVDPRNGGNASLEKFPVDLDDAGLVVASGRGDGGRHFYFKAPNDVALVQHLSEYPGIDFKSSGYVVGPGSMHQAGGRYTIIDGNIDDIDEPPSALIDLLRKPERHRTEYNGAVMDVSHSDVADMLSHVNPDTDHETWVHCGMAVHETLKGDGFDIWDTWSAKGTKYPGSDELEKRWHSFGKSANPVTIGTLIYHAEQGGWVQSVTFEHDLDDTTDDEEPLDTGHIDLLRPPGFVGEVCNWINAQCRYPREHLAVAAALVAMGNVVGLRHTDDMDGVTTNLFAFGVAGSGTGKESVLQAVEELHHAAGLSAAVYGPQKSSQEVTRNLIRHQASFYVIDEFGIELKRVVNAQEKGNSSYLEGLPAALMSYYSKAGGYAPIGGDTKEDIRSMLIKEIAQHEKAIENNEDKSGARQSKKEAAERMLANLDRGLDRPFLSMIGFTTPSTFDDIMTESQASSGFIGRALLVREHDTNPRDKRPFRKQPLSPKMAGTLQQLSRGGTYDALNDRVECYDDRLEVRTTDDAKDALTAALDWFLDYAERQKEISGLEPIPRRGYELVSKVSLILAAPSGIRTLEHVRWAFALVKRDVDEKIRLVMSNDATHGQDRQLMTKITKIISKDHGETFGVIKNRLRKYKPEDVRRALDVMTEGGAAKKVAEKHKKTGVEVERWYFQG